MARPLHDIPGFFESSKELRADIARLEAENANLRGQVATTSEVRYRAAELDGLLAASRTTDLALVPARVVAMGPAQAFTHTVTIDAGTSSGIHADMTVINNAGLVGRVLHASRSTRHRAARGRRGLRGRRPARLQRRGRLPARSRRDRRRHPPRPRPGRQLRDARARTTSSSPGAAAAAAPYVAGIPIGTVGSVFSSPREQSKHAVITPFVDFSSLDLVGVVVDGDTQGDRPVIRAGEVPEEDRLMPVVRAALFTVLLLAAVVLQTAFFPYFAFDGVVAQRGAARRGGRRR